METQLKPPRIPAFATILGLRLGVATMETLEHKLGPGLPYTGWWIDADGFNYDLRRRQVLDFICVSADAPWGSKKPHARCSARDLRWHGVVALGMSHAQVRRALRRKLPPPEIVRNNPRLSDGDLIWESEGLAQYNWSRYDDKTSWDACLHFQGDRLVSLYIGC